LAITNRNRPKFLKKTAQIIAGMNAVFLLAALAISLSIYSDPAFDFVVLIAIVYTVIAVMIISRQPGHTVGWLFLSVGFFSALAILIYGSEELATEIFSEKNIELLYWIGNGIWIPVFFIPITLVLQFFPDGRLPSQRWWPVTAATMVGILGIAAGLLFAPWPLEEEGVFLPNNPFAIPGGEDFLASVSQIAEIFLGIGLVGSMIVVVVRYRRSSGIERIQMKWLVYTAVTGILLLLWSPTVIGFIHDLGFDLGDLSDANQISDFVFETFPIFLAIAVGIAILRYRLFDIDIIIRRTLQYAIVTVILALVYFGLVVILQSLFSAVGNQESPIFIVLSTLVIAGLFNPLRKRVQDSIDRRFYRQKYHSEQTLARFATTARDEVDLDRLSEALVEVVQETMQPDQVSLTLLSDKR
jgi:hypothetical protein